MLCCREQPPLCPATIQSSLRTYYVSKLSICIVSCTSCTQLVSPNISNQTKGILRQSCPSPVTVPRPCIILLFVTSLSGIQQVCVQRETVPSPEENRGDFGGIQQSTVCECSEVLCYLTEVEALLCKYVHFVTLSPHGLRQKYLGPLPTT